MEIDPVTGLPKDLVAFEDLSKESQNVTVSMTKKRFGKKYTIIEGIDEKNTDIKHIAKSLKSKFSCGGTFKHGRIELQGDYRTKIMEPMKSLGFSPEHIIVK